MLDASVIIKKTHPIYKEYVNDWIYYLDHYKGGREFLRKGYLRRYSGEQEVFWNDRKARACYHNNVAIVVDTFYSFIYSKEIMRKTEGNDYEQSQKR